MAAAAIALVWLGMVLGVSFLATPVKFVVQDLSLPVALQVGQATFNLFAQVEWALGLLLLVAAWFGRNRLLPFLLAAALCGLLLLQALWLLPVLDARVNMIVAGQMPPASSHHMLYGWLEAVKAILLVALAFAAVWRRYAATPSA